MNTTTKAQRTNKAKREMTEHDCPKCGEHFSTCICEETTTSHTPGPWSYSGVNTDLTIMARRGHERITVCVLACNDDYGNETDANKRLIAAAPDYHDKAHKLAMRILQSDFYRYAKQEVDDVLDVYRKAEGQ